MAKKAERNDVSTVEGIMKELVGLGISPKPITALSKHASDLKLRVALLESAIANQERQLSACRMAAKEQARLIEEAEQERKAAVTEAYQAKSELAVQRAIVEALVAK